MISLLAPLGLAALAAWLLPLLIHWVRRSDRQIIPFAAMRYLSEQVHPRERLRLYEPWLLLLRLLLIAALALLLAVPILRSAGAPSVPWVLVAPGVPAAAARAAVAEPAAEWRWLAPGLPPLDAPLPVGEPDAALSSLVRQADAELPPRAPVTLVVPQELGGLDAERVRLAHAFTWRALPGSSPIAHADAGAGPYAAADSDSRAPPPRTLAVRADAAGAAELPLVRALAAAWQIEGVNIQWDIAPPDAPLPPAPAWLIWLAGPLPPGIDAWARGGGTVLASRQTQAGGGVVAFSDANGVPVLWERQLGRGRLLSFAGPMRVGADPATSASLSDADFPRALLALMRGPPPAPDRALAAAVVPQATGRSPVGPAQSLLPALAFAVAFLFLAERLLATRRRGRA